MLNFRGKILKKGVNINSCQTFYIEGLSAMIYLEPTPQFNPSLEVAAIYTEYDDQILLLHRQNNKSQGNKWGIPGGKVKKMKILCRQS